MAFIDATASLDDHGGDDTAIEEIVTEIFYPHNNHTIFPKRNLKGFTDKSHSSLYSLRCLVTVCPCGLYLVSETGIKEE